ncbi:hypothetical protein GCM10023192_56630 [Amycolatopsis samaneae]
MQKGHCRARTGRVAGRLGRGAALSDSPDLHAHVLTEVALAVAESIAGSVPRKALHPARALGLPSDHSGQSATGRKASGKHKTPGHRFR